MRPRNAGDRIKRVALAALIQHIVKEGAELRARERDARIRHELNQFLEIELLGDQLRSAVERLKPRFLLGERVGRRLLLRNVGICAEPADDLSGRIPNRLHARQERPEYAVCSAKGKDHIEGLAASEA